jgi:hypothetical protein
MTQIEEMDALDRPVDLDGYWRALLLDFSRQQGRIVARWMMANGADFYMSIPAINEIHERTFSENICWPFLFREIDQLVFYNRDPLAPYEAQSLPELDLLSKHSAFSVDEFELGIVITPLAP